MNKLVLITALAAVFMLFSCGRAGTTVSRSDGDTVEFRYARLIEMVRYDDYTVVRLADPWNKGKVLHTYVLVPRSSGKVTDLPEGTVIRTPLRRAISFTTVHTALAIDLGCRESIAGVADLQYNKLSYITQQCRNGKIADVGNSMNPDIEKIIDACPDAVLVSPFENSGGYGKLEETGIPIIECSDYMETSPLGRAEWMRFYGMLLGAEKEADRCFAAVDSSYHALKAMVDSSTVRPTVLMDKITGPVWYVPGGCSTIGVMLKDAGFGYAFAGDGHSGSLSLSFESVLEKCGDADVWLFRYCSKTPLTYAGLYSEYHGYDRLRPFRERACYGCNVETSLFYEESPFRPDYLLGDLIRIAHPELGLSGGMRYFEKLSK